MKLSLDYVADWVPPQQGDWTIDDYMRLPDVVGIHYELIDGRLFMKASPCVAHQRAVGAIACSISSHVRRERIGKAVLGPIDVLLGGAETCVVPDVVFVTHERRDIITDDNIDGVPDLIVEVISPGHDGMERYIKLKRYWRARVPEYWIVDPEGKSIEIWVTRTDVLVPLGFFTEGQSARSEVVRGLQIPVDNVFIK